MEMRGAAFLELEDPDSALGTVPFAPLNHLPEVLLADSAIQRVFLWVGQRDEDSQARRVPGGEKETATGRWRESLDDAPRTASAVALQLGLCRAVRYSLTPMDADIPRTYDHVYARETM
jgi:hypothetical protein